MFVSKLFGGHSLVVSFIVNVIFILILTVFFLTSYESDVTLSCVHIYFFTSCLHRESVFDVSSQTAQIRPSYWPELTVVGEEECVSLEVQTQLCDSGLI